jgi:5-methylcytosine-specific restriction endonuclease McrA
VDHVVPRAQGGADSWLNTVASCAEDNHRKADRTPEQAGMPLLREPFEPSPADAMLLSLGADEFAALPSWLAREAA